MSFFTRQPATAGTKSPMSEADNIILNAGRIAEQTMLDCFSQSAAFWTAYRRKQAADLERDFPGYQEDLKRHRAATGLPPL